LRVPEASVHASLQERRGTRWRNHASGADPDPQQVDRRRHLPAIGGATVVSAQANHTSSSARTCSPQPERDPARERLRAALPIGRHLLCAQVVPYPLLLHFNIYFPARSRFPSISLDNAHSLAVDDGCDIKL